MDETKTKLSLHTIISLIKSGVRIIGCGIAAVVAITNPSVGAGILCMSLIFAEVIGIVEELAQ